MDNKFSELVWFDMIHQEVGKKYLMSLFFSEEKENRGKILRKKIIFLLQNIFRVFVKTRTTKVKCFCRRNKFVIRHQVLSSSVK